MSNIIGRGEATVSRILFDHFHLKPVKKVSGWHVGNDWFCPQVQFTDIVPHETLSQYDTYQQRTSVDFIARVNNQTFAIYVNGPDHDGRLKYLRDQWRYDMLKSLDFNVVVVSWQECPTILHENYSEEAIHEFKTAAGAVFSNEIRA